MALCGAFGYGIHACMGAALARIEGRIALEEVLKRFTDWEVDYDNAELSSATAVRGWETMPTFTGPGGRAARDARKAEKAASTRVERSEEHTSELQSLMRISYAVF